jgi:hypothetical protein
VSRKNAREKIGMTDAKQEGKIAPKIWIKTIATTIRLGLAAGEEHGPITLDQNSFNNNNNRPRMTAPADDATM